MSSFVVVPGSVAQQILSTYENEMVAIVRDVYLRHDRGQTVNPDSYFLRFPKKPDSRIIALPASIALDAKTATGLKWISSFPGNVKRGEPRASAVLILNDYETGRPVACIEAAGISAMRTAASVALSVSAVSESIPASGELSIIGAGVIARNILRQLQLVGHRIDLLTVHDLDPVSAHKLATYATDELGISARVDDLDRALRSQLIITATTAPRPYISEPLAPGQVVINVSLRDFSPEVILLAQNYLDDVDHCLKADTSPHLAERLTGNRDFVSGTIADMLQERRTPSPDSPVIVSPFGLGVLDVAVGAFVLRKAKETGGAVQIDEFWGDLNRW